MRDPEARRLAARLEVLWYVDKAAARHLARLAELQTTAARQLAEVERRAWDAANRPSVEPVAGSRDDTSRILAQAGELALAAGRLRRLVKNARERSRKHVVDLEQALDLRAPERGRSTFLRSGRKVVAIQWTVGAGPRRIDSPSQPPDSLEEP